MILLTGASGYLGRHLTRHLRGLGHEIAPVLHDAHPAVEPRRAWVDLANARHMETLAKYGPHPDTVIHLGGEVSAALSANPQGSGYAPIPAPARLGALYTANVVATANVATYCEQRGVRHLIFASSQAVYGLPSTETLTEESPTAPLEHYAASKVACEVLLEVASRRGLAVTVLRFPGIYGGDRQSGAVYHFCQRALSEGRIRVTQNYPLPYDVLHLDDLLSAFARVAAVGGDGYRVLNIATGEPCSLTLLADDIANLVNGCVAEHAVVPQPVIRLDAAKAERVLGWRAMPRRERLAEVLEEVRCETSASLR